MRGLQLKGARGCMKRAKNEDKMRRMWCEIILIKSEMCIHVWCEIGAQREIRLEVDGTRASLCDTSSMHISRIQNEAHQELLFHAASRARD